MSTDACNFKKSGDSCKEPSYNFPQLTSIISQLNYDFENYKYTVYRCASKFITIQKKFFTSNIPYKLILAVMDRHGIRDEDINLMVPPFQLTSLIHDVYFACEKLGNFSKLPSYTLESATAVLSNFFWNIYDPHRRHSISLLEIKVTFLLLCKLYSSDELVPEFYYLLKHKKTKCVPKLNLEYMLNILAKIFSYIGEGAAYGAQNIELVIDQCYARCQNLSGLTEHQFHSLWRMTQSRFLIYANLIALIKRIGDTEKLIHFNACASCNVEKITGIRFKCQSCKCLSLCLKCFATGYITNKHVISHRMYEVYTEDLPPKKYSFYFSKLCSVFFCSSKIMNDDELKGFCGDNETIVNNETELVTLSADRTSSASTNITKTTVSKPIIKSETRTSKDTGHSPELQKINSSLACLKSKASNAVNVSEKLQTIIDKLIRQNQKLELQLKRMPTSTEVEVSRFLSDHQRFLVNIIEEMRNFSETSSETIDTYPTSSTPNRFNSVKTTSLGLDNYSALFSPQHNESLNYSQYIQNTVKDNLTRSINGVDINRSYLEANKSDYSTNDLSLWFNQRRHSSMPPSLPSGMKPLSVLMEVSSQNKLNSQKEVYMDNTREIEMTNFKRLLNKVKEIVEDSYSDNTELSEATQNLENVLDSIIKTEECKRKSLN